MGQRSQIYVRYYLHGKKELIANYYGWNYGERMISRARYGIKWIKDNQKYPFNFREKLHLILDVNFDMKDIVIHSDIIKEYYFEEWEDEPLNDFLFYMQNNNDGKLLIDVSIDGNIKYAFLNWDASSEHIMNGDDYMLWNLGENWKIPDDYRDEETIKICQDNIAAISKDATLMSKEEVEAFLNDDYSGITKPNKE